MLAATWTSGTCWNPPRLVSKKISKTQAVASQIPYDLGNGNVHIGPSDFVSWLSDRKCADIRLEGKSFGDIPLNLKLKLEVWDSPNSAGVVIDAMRAVQIARDRGMGGPLPGPSAYFMKSPPVQLLDEMSRNFVVEFISDRSAGRGPYCWLSDRRTLTRPVAG